MSVLEDREGTLWLGSESGSQRLLDRMGRLTRVEEVQAATAMLKELYEGLAKGRS